MQGDSGAPLEPDERAELEKAFPKVRKYLRTEALEAIEESGVWEEVETDGYATTCVDGAACVFVTYEGPVAKCALQKAYQEERIDFPKPISCHLYPIRIQTCGEIDLLNYEQISLCDPARHKGRQMSLQLADFLREPLVRRYGEAWYEQFRETIEARREALSPAAGT